MAQEASLRLGVDSRPAEQGARRATSALAEIGRAANAAVDRLDKAEKSLRGLNRAADQMKAAGKALTVGVSLPLAGLAGFSVKAAAEMDSLRRAMDAVTGSSAETSRQIGRLTVLAKLPGIGFQEAIQGSVRLQAIGFSAQFAERTLKGFANAIALTGGGRDELQRVQVQVGQLAAKGKILAMDLRPIIEAAPAVGRALRDAFGTVDPERIEAMGFSTDQFLDILLTQLEKLPQVSGGAKNAMENLADAGFRARAALGDALLPAVLPLVDGLANLLEKTESLNPKVMRTAIAFGAAAAVVGPLSIGIASLATAVGTLVIAGAPLWPLLAAGGAITVGLSTLVGLFVKNKLEALAAAGAVDAFKASLVGMNKEQLLTQRTALMGQKSKIADMIGNLSGGKGNAGRLAKLRQQGMDVVGALTEVDRALRGLAEGSSPTKTLNLELNETDKKLKRLVERTQELGLSFLDTLDVVRAINDIPLAVAGLRNVRPQLARQAAPITRNGITGRTTVHGSGMDLGRKSAPERQGPSLGLRLRAAGGFARQGDFGGAAGALGASDALRGLAAGATSLLSVFNPLAIIATVFKAALESLAPVLQPLTNIIGNVAAIFANALTPILKGLFPAFKLTAIAATYVGQIFFNVAGAILSAVGYLVRGLGRFIDSIPGLGDFGLRSAGQAMIDAGKGFMEGAAELATARDRLKELEWEDAIKPLETAANRAAGSLLNFANVVHVNALRNRVIAGSSGGLGIPGPTDRGGNLPPVNISITVDRDGNGEATVARAGRAAERHRMRGGTTRMALAV
jgi:tape measure domain-containing protein